MELRGFGAFSVKNRPARTGRNPRTGAHVSVEQKSVPFFKTGKEMRERLNKQTDASGVAVSSLRGLRDGRGIAGRWRRGDTRAGRPCCRKIRHHAHHPAFRSRIVIVMFAVANREIVTVSFDPFDPRNPALGAAACRCSC